MLFKRINKVLTITCKSEMERTQNRGKKSIKQAYLVKYSPGSPEKLDHDLRVCLNTSAVKLKKLFQKYPILALDFSIVLTSASFVKLFFSERKLQAMRYCIKELAQMNASANTQLKRKDKLKTFPLSKSDFIYACEKMMIAVGIPSDFTTSKSIQEAF